MSTPQWYEDWFPELRSERPWLMEEMIDSEPALAARIASNKKLGQTAARIAKKVAEAHGAGTSITVVGCGTSEHAARSVAVHITSIQPALRQPQNQYLPGTAAAVFPDRKVFDCVVVLLFVLVNQKHTLPTRPSKPTKHKQKRSSRRSARTACASTSPTTRLLYAPAARAARLASRASSSTPTSCATSRTPRRFARASSATSRSPTCPVCAFVIVVF